ncbi:hypothetical protein SynRS9902_01229 [Synechococcus sp. RS9902]|nr:hypothetical protein SynRS9902_01229 [Synechococcus sp. RS9902]
MAMPDIWTKSRGVEKTILIASSRQARQHRAVDTRKPPP